MGLLRKKQDLGIICLIGAGIWLGLVLTKGAIETTDSPEYYAGWLNFDWVGNKRGYVLPFLFALLPSPLLVSFLNVLLYLGSASYLCSRLASFLGTKKWFLTLLVASPVLTHNAAQWTAYVLAHAASLATGMILLALIIETPAKPSMPRFFTLAALIVILSDIRPGSLTIAMALAGFYALRVTFGSGDLRAKMSTIVKGGAILFLAVLLSWWNLSETSGDWEPINGEMALLPFALKVEAPLTVPYIEKLHDAGAPGCLIPDQPIPSRPTKSEERSQYQSQLASCEEGASWFSGRHSKLVVGLIAENPSLLSAQLRYSIGLTWASAEFAGGYSIPDPVGALWFGGDYDSSRMTLIVSFGLVASALLVLLNPRMWLEALLCPLLVLASLTSQLLFTHRASPRMYVDHNILILVSAAAAIALVLSHYCQAQTEQLGGESLGTQSD